VEPVARDDQISVRIQQILEAAGWYENARVTVDDGVVFLDGIAKTDEQKDWARNLALKTQDVVAVVNRIEVVEELQSNIRPVINELLSLARKAIITLPLFIIALVILPLAWKASKLVARLAEKVLSYRIDSPFLREVLSRAISIPVFLIGLYVVLQVAGLTGLALSLLGGAGVIGIVIGFAFRDIAENFLASLLLSIRQPFKGGNYISVAGHEGIVQSMNTRSTVLLSSEGNHIQIPNADVFKSTIVNYSANPSRRGTLDVGIGYDVAVAAGQEVISDVLANHEAVMTDPAPLVLVDSLGSSTVNLKVYYWFDGHKYSSIKVKSALLRLMKKALVEAGISMPDDAREMIFPQGVPIVQLDGSAERTARALASHDIEEVARAEATVEESSETATRAEGDLENEREDLEAQAASVAAVEGETDLLEEGKKSA
jgi:small-conductance mechanosensitive channel